MNLPQFAKELHSAVLSALIAHRTHLFLCGKSLDDKSSLRSRLAQAFTDNWTLAWHYRCVFPEDLFEELLIGPFHKDLLSLENILADAVDAVVVIPESWGAVTELGAFANHEQLRKKLVCIQDEDKRRIKSFINYGPIRLLRDSGEGRVVYVDSSDIKAVVSAVRKSVEDIVLRAPRTKRITAINADQFLLAAVYLLEPVDERTLIQLIQHSEAASYDGAYAITKAGIAVLRRNALIESTPNAWSYETRCRRTSSSGYRVTMRGIQQIKQGTARAARPIETSNLDVLRAEALHMQYKGYSRVRAASS